MMTYHPPITTYTPEQEQRMQAVCIMAERMMAQGYGYTRPSKYEPTPEPQLSAGDYMTLAEVSERYGYGFGWLFDHDIPNRGKAGVTYYSSKAVINEHERLRGLHTLTRLEYVIGATQCHLRTLRQAGLLTPVYGKDIYARYDRDAVLDMVRRYPLERVRDLQRLNQLPTPKK